MFIIFFLHTPLIAIYLYSNLNFQMKTKFSLVQQGVTNLEAEGIVNSTNTATAGRDAMCQKAGKIVQESSAQLLAARGPLVAADTFITEGGALSAKKIIHVIAPLWNPNIEDKNQGLLALAYVNVLDAAREAGIKILALQPIATGLEKFPKKQAAQIALNTVGDYLESNPDSFDSIIFVCDDAAEFKIYEKRWEDFLKRMNK